MNRKSFSESCGIVPLQFVPDCYSGKASRSPSITPAVSDAVLLVAGAAFSFFGNLSVSFGTNPQSFSLSFSRLSGVTPSFLTYSSNSKEPETQIKLPFFTLNRLSCSARYPQAHTFMACERAVSPYPIRSTRVKWIYRFCLALDRSSRSVTTRPVVNSCDIITPLCRMAILILKSSRAD